MKCCEACGRRYRDDTAQFCGACGGKLSFVNKDSLKTSEYPIQNNPTPKRKTGILFIFAALAVIALAVAYVSFNAGIWFDKEYSRFVTIDDIVYKIDGNEAKVWYADRNISGNVTIPAVCDGAAVTTIGAYSFNYCQYLTGIKLPEGVEVIESSAFAGCGSLTDIQLPDSIVRIDSNYIGLRSFSPFVDTAYYDDQNNWSGNILYIGNHLIDASDVVPFDTIKEETVFIADRINVYVADDSLTIPDSIKAVGFGVISESGEGIDLVVHSDVRYIDGESLSSEDIKSITVDRNNKNYTSIDGVLFNKDASVLLSYPMMKQDTGYVVPESVKSINDWAFYNEFIENVLITKNVENIGTYAFSYCNNLNYIDIDGTVKRIGEYAFAGTAFIKDENNYEDGLLYIGEHLIRYDGWFNSGNTLHIKKGTTVIADGASLGGGESLSIVLPESLKYIGSQSFASDEQESLYIPAGVEEISSDAFICSILEHIEVSPDNQNYKSIDGVLYSKDGKTLIYYPAMKQGYHYTVPDGTQHIDSFAFHGAVYKEYIESMQLRSITLPDGLESIGTGAFVNRDIGTITIPESTVSISHDCFGVHSTQRYTEYFRMTPFEHDTVIYSKHEPSYYGIYDGYNEWVEIQ